MDRIWTMIRSNLPQKIIAIIFAVILWSYVMGDQNPNISRVIRHVPVEFQNEAVLKSKNLAWMDREIQEVSVKIEGRRSDVANFKPYDIKAVADMSSINVSGTQKIPIKLVNVPGNIEVVDITPAYVEVKIEDVLSNQIPVELKVDGQPAQGHQLLQAELVPDEIIVTGPKSLVSKVRTAAVHLDVTNARSDIMRSLPIILYDERGRQISDDLGLSAHFVKVYQKIRAVKDVPVKVNTTGKLPEGLLLDKLTSEPNTVTIAGSDEGVSKVAFIETDPIDLSKIQTTSAVKAQLIPPDGIEVIKGEPVIIDVSVKEQELQKDVNVMNLTVENIPSGLKLDGQPGSVLLSLSGSYSAIKDLKPSDIKVVVDASGLNRGKYEVTPTVVLPDGIKLVKMEPQKVLVSLK